MAASKRLRYEVLRRDNYTCRYCGQSAPDVKLTVDHVLPTALGGSDAAENLVSACVDCNAGKSSSNPDATIVAAVSDDAIRWAAAVKQAADNAAADVKARAKYANTAERAWKTYDKTLAYSGTAARATYMKWHDLDVPMEMVREAIDLAWAANHVTMNNTFRYMAGIVWKRLQEIQERAKASIGVSVAPITIPWHCTCGDDDGCYYAVFGNDLCEHCGQKGCAYQHGYYEALPEGYEAAYRRHRFAILQQQWLAEVVDNIPVHPMGHATVWVA